ncbi:MAG TPA: hypothetical protein VNP72_06540, partial [Longimicrobium sp.]|nr:hypothetical protein [Longimicrobium sp.]
AASGSQYEVFRYRAGASVRISGPGGSTYRYLYPETDGVNIVYMKDYWTTSPTHNEVRLYDGTADILLAGNTASLGYLVNGGYAAYHVYDLNGVAQVWVRSPDGTLRQATSHATASRALLLTDDGRLVYGTNGRYYVKPAPHTGAPTDLGQAHGDARLEWRHGMLLLFLGRSGFTIGI